MPRTANHLNLVIPTGAKRRGEPALSEVEGDLQCAFRPQPLSELSIQITNAKVHQPFKLCHPERSRGTCSSPLGRNGATMSKREHHYYVYIVASRTRVLYCGMTNSVARRTEEHRSGAIPGFSADYQCNRLVWFEHYRYVHNAINREKEIKRWTRAKKINLIEETNSSWSDLSEAWRVETAGPSPPLPRFPV
jgi:putative endonuclease